MLYKYSLKYKKKHAIHKKPILIKDAAVEQQITENTICCCVSGRKYKKCCSPNKQAVLCVY